MNKLSVLFVSYNRSDLLSFALQKFNEKNDYQPCELIVADDCSAEPHRSAISKLNFDKHVMATSNRGLGANNNAGLAECSGDYILMLQDDWEATSLFTGAAKTAISIMENDPEVGMVRFYGDPTVFPLVKKSVLGIDYWVCDHLSPNYTGRNSTYSDTPHIRRRILNDSDQIGLYRENCPMEESEHDYGRRFVNQSKWKVAFLFPSRREYFIHLGAERSHRTSKARYRIDSQILKFVAFVGLEKETWIYKTLRALWFRCKNLLIRFNIID